MARPEGEFMSEKPAAAFTGPELCRYEAHEIVRLLARHEISPNDLLEASFQRMAEVEPVINAMPTLCPERAFAAAAALADQKPGPKWLGGLPLGIKDLTLVEGVRTTFGTAGLADFIPQKTDPMVRRIEARGGIVVGKSNTPEMGAGGNTFNAVFGPTRNPWDSSLNPGGSSGGAAAALATGETWLSQGSDHGGSLRTPAAFCGVVGLRPSPGRVANQTEAGFLIEGTSGPMARSVRDCALFLDVMADHNPRSPISYPGCESGSFQEAVLAASPKIRIGFTPDFNGLAPVDEPVRAHLAAVLEKMQAAGATIEETCPQLDGLERTYHTLRGIMWATLTHRMPDKITRHFKPALAENATFGQGLSMADIADANLDRTRLYHAMVSYFENWDVLACPVVGCLPHKQSEEWVREVGGVRFEGYMDWLRHAFLATVTGLPAISVPVGLGPGGLPVGLQLIGKPRGEAALLAAARAVEMVVGGPLPPIDPIGAADQASDA